MALSAARWRIDKSFAHTCIASSPTARTSEYVLAGVDTNLGVAEPPVFLFMVW